MFDRLSGATRLVPIVGDPIAQVKAPYGVTQAFANRGADTVCVPLQVRAADWPALIACVRILRNVDGLIATIPHKFAAFEACDQVSDRARFLRTVNTIRRSADGRLHGDMFDGLGFVAACQDHGCRFGGGRALLVGVGGAGTAIAHAVASEGVAELGLVDLDFVRRDALIERLRAANFPVAAATADPTGYDIVLNATPLGMRPDDPLPVDPTRLRADMFVGDVITQPEISTLIAAARAAGCATSTGSDMFLKVRDLMVDFLLLPA